MNKESYYLCLWKAEIDHDESFHNTKTWDSKYHLETTNDLTDKDRMFALLE